MIAAAAVALVGVAAVVDADREMSASVAAAKGSAAR
jgi:hypothetical protein